jgi:hypothetical protein
MQIYRFNLGGNMLDDLIKEAVTKVEDQKELEKLVPKVDMEVLIEAVYEVKKDVFQKKDCY